MTTLQIQALLTYLGYYHGAIDGAIGPQTQAALLEAVANGRFREDAKTPEESTGTFWDHIRYFKREEKGIACPCGRCGGFPVEPTERLMRLADNVRELVTELTAENTTLVDDMAQMIEEVYQSDMEMMGL